MNKLSTLSIADVCSIWRLQYNVLLDNRPTKNSILKLEIRSVERGICPIATSRIINERTVPIMAGCMAHEREGYISTSGLKSDVTIVFLDPDFLLDA